MNRFVFEFEGSAPLTPREFFANGVPEEITNDSIEDALMGVSMFELLNDWDLINCMSVTMMDVVTGAMWKSTGLGWRMVKDRDLLPGEQRLFK